MHLDIVLSLSAIADAASMGPTFVHNELEILTDSDYESDCRLEIPDFHTASGEINDMQNDSDTEDFPTHRSACALRVKKLFPVQADHSAKLLAIQSSTRP